MKIKLLSITFVAILMTSCSQVTFPEWDDPDIPGMHNPLNPGDDGDEPYFDKTIYSYNGTLATDGAEDIVGTDENIFWEANSFTNKVNIIYSENKAKVECSNEKILVYIDGNHVVIDMLTNSVNKTEITVSGTSSDGSLKIYGEKKYKLTLAGIDLTSQKGPAINSQCKKRVYVHLNDDSVNKLTDTSSYSDDIYYQNPNTSASEDRKGCFFSEGNMIFSGKGSLVVSGKNKHGICTDGYLYTRPGVTIAVTDAVKNAIHVKGDEDDGLGVFIAGGYIYTNCNGKAGKGVKCDLNVEIAGGKLDLNTTGDAYYDTDDKDTSSAAGIKADGNITISGGELVVKSTGIGGKGLNANKNIHLKDGLITVITTGKKYIYTNSLTASPKGIKGDGNVTIDGGTIKVSVTGISDGSEGIESKDSLAINGGSVYVYAYDDAINAAKDITINGGSVYAYAVNNDGIDSNGTMNLNGGLVIACGASSPEESFDCDRSVNLTVRGGTLIGVAGGAISPSSSTTQQTVIYNGISSSKGKNISILDKSGVPIMTFTMPRTLSRMALFFSSPDLNAGESYSISKDGKLTGAKDTWNGWSKGGNWSEGTNVGSFTCTNMVTTIGSSNSPGGGRW